MAVKCSVETVDWLDSATDFSNESQQHPVLVDFRPKRKAEEFDEANVRLKAAKTDGEGKFEPDEVFAQVDGLEYRGFRNVDNADIDTFIVARNKKTGECHLVETEMLFTVYPSVCTKDSQQNSSDKEEMEEGEDKGEEGKPEKSTQSRMEMREQLMEHFGSSKSKRVVQNIRRQMEQKMSDKWITQYTEKAGAMVAQSKTESQNASSGDGTSRYLAPPHNIDAKTPEEAYPLEKLVSEQEFKELQMMASNALADLRDSSSAPTNPGWHEFIFRMLLQVAHDKSDEDLRLRRAMACYYLHFIVKLIRMPRRMTRSSQTKMAEELRMHENHVQVLLERFMEPELDTLEFVRTRSLSDTLVYTGTVLWLTIEGFKNCKGLGEVAAALNVTPKEMTMIVVRLGGKISKRKSNSDELSDYRARLVVPLKFPVINVSRRRKSKRRIK